MGCLCTLVFDLVCEVCVCVTLCMSVCVYVLVSCVCVCVLHYRSRARYMYNIKTMKVFKNKVTISLKWSLCKT